MWTGYKVLAACAPGYYESGDAGVLAGYKVLAACALICAFKRLLCRAALFL